MQLVVSRSQSGGRRRWDVRRLRRGAVVQSFLSLFLCLVIVVVYPSSAHSRQDVIRLITPSKSTGHVHDFTSNQTAAAAAAVSMETEVAECHAKHLYFAGGKPQRAPRTQRHVGFLENVTNVVFEGRF